MQKPLLGYVVAALIGAVVFVIVGFFAYATDPGGWPFRYWLTRDPIESGVHIWAGLGLLIGAAARYAATR